MKRKLKTFGIFTPSQVNGNCIEGSDFETIYKKLKKFGFQETKWQFIYQDQIAGLVLPFKRTNCASEQDEIHIRFYKNRIFAEFEIGRAYPSHFIGPRYNANRYLFKMIRQLLNEQEISIWDTFSNRLRMTSDELQLEEWHGEARFEKFRSVQNYSIISIAIAILFNIGWKWIAGTITLGLLWFFGPSIFTLILTSIAIISAVFVLPSSGKP